MENDFDPESLRALSPEEQRDQMEVWFRANFEDPAERTPYESAEGGYIWIWGGPYDAEEELRAQFEGIVEGEVIEDLAADLSGENPGWAPVSRPEDYDHGLYEAVSANELARQTLDGALVTIKALLQVNVPGEHGEAYRRLLYANAITALETYLSDTFINRVFADKALLQTYIDSEPKFKERKVPYRDVLREAAKVEEAAKQELLDVVWHNVGKTKAMYEDVLGIKLGDVGKIASAVQRRHDIVHRNGRTKEGSVITVSAHDILALINEVETLASRIEVKLDYGFDDESGNGTPAF